MDSHYNSNITSYKINSGKVAFGAPSNIALVKYWGKRPVQIPENASLSFTLSACRTETSVMYDRKLIKDTEINFSFLFEGSPKPSFEPKIKTFLERVTPYFSFLKDFNFIINSKNTFPHSSGIASSASGMSALARCFVAIEQELGGDLSEAMQIEKTSFLARLGSGSACRSLEGPVTVWGKHSSILNSSNEFAVKFSKPIHSIFEDYQDTVLLIDKGEKQVSSTVGHGLMHGHPFASQRFVQANNNLEKLTKVLQEGDIDEFIAIVESEALTLHAMMMSSQPYFILMKPNTLEVINEIWNFRKEAKIPVCFTLDAGANVHVLYPEEFKEQVLAFIKEKLAARCQNKQYICDYVGNGTIKL